MEKIKDIGWTILFIFTILAEGFALWLINRRLADVIPDEDKF